MGWINSLFEWHLAGGLSFITLLGINTWLFRVVMAYCRETRQEYINRLNDTVLDLEQAKNDNIRLELRIQTIEFINSLTDRGQGAK